MVGAFGIATAISTPVFTFARMRMGERLATEANDGTGSSNFHHYLYWQALLSVAAFVVVLAICGVFSYSYGMVAVVAAVAAGKGLESISEVIHGQMQRMSLTQKMGYSYGWRGLASIALAYAVLVATGSLLGALLGMLAGQLLVFVLYDVAYMRRSRFDEGELTEDKTVLRRLLLSSLPLGIVAMISAVSSNIPRYILEGMGDRAAVGIFTALFASVATINLANEALGRAFVARLSLAYHSDRGEFTRLLLFLAGGSLVLGIVGVVLAIGVGPLALGLVFGAEYAVHGTLLNVLMIAMIAGLINSHVKRSLLIIRLINVQLPIILVSACAGLVVGLLLIPALGLVGAGWSIVAVTWGELLAGLVVLGPKLSLWSPRESVQSNV